MHMCKRYYATRMQLCWTTVSNNLEHDILFDLINIGAFHFQRWELLLMIHVMVHQTWMHFIFTGSVFKPQNFVHQLKAR